MEEQEVETKQLRLSECFKLGKALRSGDADLFCEIYDSLVTPGVNSQLTVSTIKEVARQISELSQEDFITLANCYSPLSPASNDVSVDIYEPVTIQLAELIDKIKVEGQGGTITSDSGHLSDYDSCETDELKSESSSEVTLCGESDTPLLADPLFDSRGFLFEESLILKDTRIGPVVDPSDLMIQSDEEKSLTEKKIAFLSKVAGAQNGEDIQSNNAEVFTVSQLEKEFFSDSSEDVSPETSTLPYQQDDEASGESDTRGNEESHGEASEESCMRGDETLEEFHMETSGESHMRWDETSEEFDKEQYEASGKSYGKEDNESYKKDEVQGESQRFEETSETSTSERAKSGDQRWYHRETTHGTSYHPHGWSRYYGRRGGYNRSRFRHSRGGYNRSYYHQGREEQYGIREVNKIHETESWTSQKPKEKESRVSFSENTSGSPDDSEQSSTYTDMESESKKLKHASDVTEMEKEKADSSTTSAHDTKKGEKVTVSNRSEKAVSKKEGKRGTEYKQGKPATAFSSERRRERSTGTGIENKTSPERKEKHSPKHRSQLSPLVVHSQNVWSSNIEAVKSPRATKTRPSPSSGRHSKNYAFNHYEVGRFLMEGWENVMKEFAAGSGTSL